MTNEEALIQFFNAVIIDVKRTMEDKNLNASGVTAESLGYEVSGDSGQLNGSTNFYWLEYGRGPGKMPPIQSMEDWIRVRGFSDYDPWAVAKSIAANGTLIYRDKTKGVSIGAIATKYIPALLKNITQSTVLGIQNAIKKSLV
jgi:hypothetical protein